MRARVNSTPKEERNVQRRPKVVVCRWRLGVPFFSFSVSWSRIVKFPQAVYESSARLIERGLLFCVFFSKQQHPFFWWTRRERLYRRNIISLCLVIYIITLCFAFVRRAFAETNKEREREKKNASSRTHTHSLSRRKRRRRRRRCLGVFEF